MSCEEEIQRLLEKIEGDELNSFITICRDESLEMAKKVDRGEIKGRLAGVPVAIKDNISTKGIRTTCASKILLGYVPPYDAHVIEELKREGAIIIGKTNMDEFAMGSTTETSYFGPTRNPWDRSRVPGGSSGGSAAAVAAGYVQMALGSDTGGSVRCPASFCGVVGIKPTYGLVSRYGLIAYANSLEQIGTMGRCVRDAALLLEIIATYDQRDSTCVRDVMRGGYVSSLIDDVRGMKIAVPKELFEVDGRVSKCVWSGIHTLESLGATYEEISMRYVDFFIPAYYIIAMSEASSNLARYDGVRYGLKMHVDGDWNTVFSAIRGDGFGKEVKRRILLGTYALSAGYYGRYYLKALKARALIKREFESILSKYDLMITPTMPFVAFRIGEKIDDPLALYMSDINTVAVNLAGVPAISVPCGWVDGLPVGMQIIGKHWDERKIIRAAYTFERNAKISGR